MAVSQIVSNTMALPGKLSHPRRIVQWNVQDIAKAFTVWGSAIAAGEDHA
jgi:hypothetical protein